MQNSIISVETIREMASGQYAKTQYAISLTNVRYFSVLRNIVGVSIHPRCHVTSLRDTTRSTPFNAALRLTNTDAIMSS